MIRQYCCFRDLSLHLFSQARRLCRTQGGPHYPQVGRPLGHPDPGRRVYHCHALERFHRAENSLLLRRLLQVRRQPRHHIHHLVHRQLRLLCRGHLRPTPKSGAKDYITTKPDPTARARKPRKLCKVPRHLNHVSFVRGFYLSKVPRHFVIPFVRGFYLIECKNTPKSFYRGLSYLPAIVQGRICLVIKCARRTCGRGPRVLL